MWRISAAPSIRVRGAEQLWTRVSRLQNGDRSHIRKVVKLSRLVYAACIHVLCIDEVLVLTANGLTRMKVSLYNSPSN